MVKEKNKKAEMNEMKCVGMNEITTLSNRFSYLNEEINEIMIYAATWKLISFTIFTSHFERDL